jgi:hypothetical protein
MTSSVSTRGASAAARTTVSPARLALRVTVEAALVLTFAVGLADTCLPSPTGPSGPVASSTTR